VTKGALLIARNNGELDYVKQAVFLAKRIKKYLNIPTSIITDSVDYIKESFDKTVFDEIISVEYTNDLNTRNFYDGTLSYKTANFKNNYRINAYDLSPYDETLLLDTDYIISNDLFKSCFASSNDLQMFTKAHDVANIRDPREFIHLSEYSIDFYWATVVFFRKTPTNKIFFDLIKHIQENWYHYVSVYQLNSTLFRNDFAFSIAIHIMNGFSSGDFVSPLPGKHLYTIDKDILWKLTDDKFIFLVEKKDYAGEYTAVSTEGQSIHVMNKFSLERVIDNE
jgi:hypothetical protein